MKKSAEYWISKLKLQKHPEGGYFKEIYRSSGIISKKNLPHRYGGSRNFSTAIYFLLNNSEVSKLHRLKSDEIWHFYDGSPLMIYIINKKGVLVQVKLGKDIEKGEKLQVVINAGGWFGAKVVRKSSYSLIGCTVAPGFDFNDFELGHRTNLIKSFPRHKLLINQLTVQKQISGETEP
jgi:hypothetical protein